MTMPTTIDKIIPILLNLTNLFILRSLWWVVFWEEKLKCLADFGRLQMLLLQ